MKKEEKKTLYKGAFHFVTYRYVYRYYYRYIFCFKDATMAALRKTGNSPLVLAGRRPEPAPNAAEGTEADFLLAEDQRPRADDCLYEVHDEYANPLH